MFLRALPVTLWAAVAGCGTGETLPGEESGRIDTSRGMYAGVASLVGSTTGARSLLFGTVLVYLVGGYLASFVEIGESEPGSPILYQDHEYNVSSRVINENFPGSEELFVVAKTDEPGGMKRPDVLRALEDFQMHMLYDPELGGTKGMPDLVKRVNRILHSDDPRWSMIPE